MFKYGFYFKGTVSMQQLIRNFEAFKNFSIFVEYMNLQKKKKKKINSILVKSLLSLFPKKFK